MLEIFNIISLSEKDLKDIHVTDKRIIVSSRDENVYYTNLETNTMFTLAPHSGNVNSVVVDDERIFCGCQNGVIAVFLFDGSPQTNLFGHSGNVCTLDAFNGMLISGSWDHTLKLWDIYESRLVESKEHPGTVWAVKFIPDGRFITGCADKIIRVFSNNTQQYSISLHNFCIRGVLFFNNTVYSIDNEGTLLNTTLEGELIGHFSFKDFMYSLSECCGNIVCCGENGKIYLLSPELELICEITAPCVSCWKVFAYDGYLYVCGSDGNLYVYSYGPTQECNPEIRNKYSSMFKKPKASISSEQEFVSGNDRFKVLDNNVYQLVNNEWVFVGLQSNVPQYDYSFSVEVEGKNYTLSFNKNDNIYEVADKFLYKNKLNSSFKDQIVEFIRKNFSSKGEYKLYYGVNVEGVKKQLRDMPIPYISVNLETFRKEDNKEVAKELKFIFENGPRFVALDLYRYFIVNGFVFDLKFLFKFVPRDRKEAVAYLRLLTVLLADPPFNLESLHEIVSRAKDEGFLMAGDLDDYYHNRTLRNK